MAAGASAYRGEPCAAAGCSLEEIGDYVGHSSTYMVDRYRHLLEGQRERAAARLDSFLTGAETGASAALGRMVDA